MRPIGCETSKSWPIFENSCNISHQFRSMWDRETFYWYELLLLDSYQRVHTVWGY